jgi:hypothetical protein
MRARAQAAAAAALQACRHGFSHKGKVLGLMLRSLKGSITEAAVGAALAAAAATWLLTPAGAAEVTSPLILQQLHLLVLPPCFSIRHHTKVAYLGVTARTGQCIF